VKNHFRTSLIFAAVLAAISMQNSALAQSQNGLAAKPAATAPSEPIPRTPDGKPDLIGVWEIPYVADMSRGIGPLPYTAWGEENFKSYDPSKFDYTAHCLPAGLTRQMNTPMPLEIFQSPKRVAILFEAWSTFIVIPTDGRDHPKDPDPTWMGNSVGHWDGDTLVVDSTNFTGETRARGADENLHLIERFTRVGPDTLLYQFTVDDPTAFTKPWSGEIPMAKTEGLLYEYACHEGNIGMKDIIAAAQADEKKAAGQGAGKK
jgi:hypothetical protein